MHVMRPETSERRAGLSLRSRVLFAVGATFALSLLGGAIGAGLRTRDSLNAELTAAVAGARQSASEPFGDLARSGHARTDLIRYVESFDGSRHVTATAFDASGAVVRRSIPAAPDHPAPGWFARLMRPHIPSIRLPAGAAGVVQLDALSDNDVADAWSELARMVAAFAAFSLLGAGLVYAVIGRALAPLTQLSDAFARIGGGDYRARVNAGGVSELDRLAAGFNHMAERLAEIDLQNRKLEDQLLTLQDEERAEIARDLHDEIGPYLFAVNLDANLAVRHLREDRKAEAEARILSIAAAVDHMQRQVREMLSQLRASPVADLGLTAALADAVDFWRGKRPDIDFLLEADLGEEAPDPAQAEALWRVAQEALSNAVRHGEPASIRVMLDSPKTGQVRVRIEDDGGAGPAEPRPGSGFGLRGMRERMAAAHGELRIEAEPGRGWTVEALAPVRRLSTRATGGDGQT